MAILWIADVAKLVDARDLGSRVLELESSSLSVCKYKNIFKKYILIKLKKLWKTRHFLQRIS